MVLWLLISINILSTVLVNVHLTAGNIAIAMQCIGEHGIVSLEFESVSLSEEEEEEAAA